MCGEGRFGLFGGAGGGHERLPFKRLAWLAQSEWAAASLAWHVEAGTRRAFDARRVSDRPTGNWQSGGLPGEQRQPGERRADRARPNT